MANHHFNILTSGVKGTFRRTLSMTKAFLLLSFLFVFVVALFINALLTSQDNAKDIQDNQELNDEHLINIKKN